jgi:hypothetical protein
MAYMAAQALLKTLLLTMTELSNDGVTEGDARVLDSGRDYFAILYPGAVNSYELSAKVREHEFEGIVQVFSRNKDAAAYATFGTFRDAVIAKIKLGRMLSENYFITSATAEGRLNDVFDKTGAGPFYVMQELSLTIQENV